MIRFPEFIFYEPDWYRFAALGESIGLKKYRQPFAKQQGNKTVGECFAADMQAASCGQRCRS
jgi:hypothetical protein